MSSKSSKFLYSALCAGLLALSSNVHASLTISQGPPTNLYYPYMPTLGSSPSSFSFTPNPYGGFDFIDPAVATGYTYTITSGPNFAAVLLPTNGQAGGQTTFNLRFGTTNTTLTAGTAFDLTGFNSAGFGTFTIDGINTAAALDPTSPTAFETGLRFINTNPVTMTQTPIVTSVPLPASITLFGLGLLSLGLGMSIKSKAQGLTRMNMV